MDIGSVLSRAWQIVWRHRVLWLFGILAGCGGVTSTGSNSASYRMQSNQPGQFQVPPEMERFFRQFEGIDPQVFILIGILLILALILLGILAFFLSILGRVGLIRGAVLADRGAERLQLSELFNTSKPYYWRVFFVTLLIGLASAVVGILLALPLIVCTLGLGLLCLVPLGWLLQLYQEQVNIAIVVEDLSITDALARAWEVIKNNFGTMILMGLILYLGVSLLVGLIIGLPFLLVLGPIIFGVAMQSAGNLTFGLPGGLITAGICLLVYFPIWLVLNGILRSYISTAWTLTYMRLTPRPVIIEDLPAAL